MEDKRAANTGGKPDGGKRGAKRAKIALVLLILLLLLLLLYMAVKGGRGGDGGPAGAVDTVFADTAFADTVFAPPPGVDTAIADTSVKHYGVDLDSLARVRRARADSLARLRALADSLARLDSLRIADSLALAESLRRADSLALADSLARLARQLAIRDSLARLDSQRRADSLSRIVDPCLRDTLAPWVTPDPSGGLHRKAVAVKLVPNKAKVIIEWNIDGGKWRRYDGQPVAIDRNSVLHYRAADDCGRKMAARSKQYKIDISEKPAKCPADMELIASGGKEFCVDVYEWPNRRGAAPAAYVSLYQAMDSCFSVRKRLCESAEWTLACAGPEGWAYLYGAEYEGNACATRDTLAQRSGSRPECRGYYPVFDMSGNLAEWTSTPSPQDRSFNNVMGGFWQSGSQSRCADARYSYFPQNRHNPVGFRCCRDAGAQQKGSGR
ncbi:MAG: SUMF1/EgtB/PvdO family nonheme iron enzyme [Chitinispirillia bacterium]|nr:SUMF1/EgtB/PvdO family nonheme iron enzyme [Chitinispirillia bacterium]MCL2242053.1 SUMF1/EgtB/PvdO family nonheme iron enzyme [Chitinispirillia bacterium]